MTRAETKANPSVDKHAYLDLGKGRLQRASHRRERLGQAKRTSPGKGGNNMAKEDIRDLGVTGGMLKHLVWLYQRGHREAGGCLGGRSRRRKAGTDTRNCCT